MATTTLRRSLALTLALLLSCALAAQRVVVTNLSALPFFGFHRVQCDVAPPHEAGQLEDGTMYVVGRQRGLDRHDVDVMVRLAPGETRSIELSDFRAVKWERPALPPDLGAFFGGPLTLGGQPMAIAGFLPNGAGYDVELHARQGSLLSVRAWLTWYPWMSWVAPGEFVVCASNAAVPDMLTASTSQLRMQFGDGITWVPGLGINGLLCPVGTAFGDGQAQIKPCAFIWPRLITGSLDGSIGAAQQWNTAFATADCAIVSCGIQRLLPDGNPILAPGFNAHAWAAGQVQEGFRRLHTWDVGTCGPNRTSGDTGEQEDQHFVGGECFQPGGVAASLVRYLAALKLGNRPCHHLELDGRQCDPLQHAACVTWDGRPHYSLGVSPDRLGKSGFALPGVPFGPPHTNGWWGPDREHWLYNTVAAGARVTGSRALQWELEQQSRLILFGETVPSMKPNWSTNGPGTARGVGWMGFLVEHLHNELDDRALAARVVQRWQQRVLQVIVPSYGAREDGVWDIRYDDPRLGPGARWMPWQQSVGALGLLTACRAVGPVQGIELADRAAACLMRDAWVYVGPGAGLTDAPQEPVRFLPPGVRLEETKAADGTSEFNLYEAMQQTLATDAPAEATSPTGWFSKDVVALDGSPVTMGYFDLFGMPMSAAAVQRRFPEDARSRAVWLNLVARSTMVKHVRWLAPGLVMQ